MAYSFLFARAQRRLVRFTSRFSRSERGSAAIEFAFVFMPFLMLVFAIIELGLAYLVSLLLENAVIDVSRTIRTGEVQSAGGTAASFKAAVCDKIGPIGSMNCSSALQLDVRTYADYSSSNSSASSTATVPSSMQFSPGTAGSIVLVRAYYTWPLVTPLLQTGLQNANGRRIIYAATAFTNEPYDP